MCAGVNCFYPLCSPLRSSWRPGHPSYQTTSRESSIQRRRSCGVEQFAAGHLYCINTLFFQKSAQDSSIFSFISVIYLISKSVCCTAPLYGHVTAPYKLSYYYYYYCHATWRIQLAIHAGVSYCLDVTLGPCMAFLFMSSHLQYPLVLVL